MSSSGIKMKAHKYYYYIDIMTVGFKAGIQQDYI